jgi:hypothetical protein
VVRDRRRRIEHFWARYAGSIAFVSLLLIAGLGFARIENARYEGCRGGNLLRAGLRHEKLEELKQTEAIDHEALFPQISDAEYAKLLDENRRTTYYRIHHNFAERPCGTRIDLPLTGASIILPP